MRWTPCRPKSSTEVELETEVYVIDATEALKSVGMPAETSTVPIVFRDAMYPTCALPNLDFRELGELHELEYQDSIRESADFVLADDPYNGQRSRDDHDSEHNQLSADDTKAMMCLCEAVLKH